MAEVFVRNSLNPYKVIRMGISFSQVANRTRFTGDVLWVIEIGTLEKDILGFPIAPYYINTVSLEDIDFEIKKAVTYLSSQVDWGALSEDLLPPYFEEIKPNTYLMDIDSTIEVKLKEYQPSSGIDLSSIKVEVNGFDVTQEAVIFGTPYEYNVTWLPAIRVRAVY